MAEETVDKDPGLPLGAIALDMVRKGDKGGEAYKIHKKGPAVLQAALNATFLSGEPEEGMARRFRAVIAVCCVLEEKKACPLAAKVLADALFADPRVVKVLHTLANKDRNRGRAYRKFLDEGDLARAPVIDSEVPDDAVKLKSFLTPGQEMARRAGGGRRTSVPAVKFKGTPPANPSPNTKPAAAEPKAGRRPGGPLPPFARKG